MSDAGGMIVPTTPEMSEQIRQWRGEIVVSRGKVHKIERLSGYIYRTATQIEGLILYDIQGEDYEIVSLDSRVEGQGIGTRLIGEVIRTARGSGCRRIWLITSNDNIRAIRFYQKRGFDMKAVHRNAITEARKLKPTIPLLGREGIPVKHEIEFEYLIE